MTTKKMNLTKKQLKAIQTVEWFIPNNIKNFNSKNTRLSSYPTVGLNPKARNWKKNGVSPEESFFSKTERGKIIKRVTDTPRLASLLWGHRWMATHIKMWQEGFSECILNPVDFVEEPEYIQEIAKKCCLATGRLWNIK